MPKKIFIFVVVVAAVFFGYRHFSEDTGDKVIVYSLSYCGYCKKLSGEMTNAGIDFVEYYVDKDRKRDKELKKKLAKNGLAGGILMPVVDLGDVFLPNRPSIETIESYFE